MLWGDGFEIETVINCRFAAARLAITEVPSVEKMRMFGESNLNAVTDGSACSGPCSPSGAVRGPPASWSAAST